MRQTPASRARPADTVRTLDSAAAPAVGAHRYARNGKQAGPARWAAPRAMGLAGLLVGVLCLATWPPAASGIGPTQRIEFFAGARGRPLAERISRGNEAILDWQQKINRDYGQEIRPRMAREDHPLIPVVRRMVAELPPRILALAGDDLLALYLLEDDFGSGTTEAVQDESGRWRYGYIALNLSVLDKRANAWGTWKDGSTFKPAAHDELRMSLEEPEQDTVAAAIRFIFLHELGHVLGLARGAHGFWDAEALPAATRDSAFVTISWQSDGQGKMVSRWKEREALLSELGFYRFDQALLSAAQEEPVYRALARTDFPSLYAATNLFDDFAETFAIYVHTRLLGRPYRVDVLHDGQVAFTYRSCVDTGRCPQKVAALKAVLGLE